jgi:hypothetical protein
MADDELDNDFGLSEPEMDRHRRGAAIEELIRHIKREELDTHEQNELDTAILYLANDDGIRIDDEAVANFASDTKVVTEDMPLSLNTARILVLPTLLVSIVGFAQAYVLFAAQETAPAIAAVVISIFTVGGGSLWYISAVREQQHFDMLVANMMNSFDGLMEKRLTQSQRVVMMKSRAKLLGTVPERSLSSRAFEELVVKAEVDG